MRVILISGKARNGKSETAKLLKLKLESQGKSIVIPAYGNQVKHVCHDYFGCTYDKNEENRSKWQFVGTDKIRKENPNHWVDAVIDIITIFFDEWDYVIIDDCRFSNELERWIGFDTLNLRVNRLNFKSALTPEQQNHISETALDNYEHFDYVINSESGLDKLEKEVDKFITWMEMKNE
jgi:hypothetical protein